MHTSPPLRAFLIALIFLSISVAAGAQIGISVSFGPPALPIYEQPPCPAEGYIWTPGYWAYDNEFDDYYWVPGTWVEAPEVGLLWTPGYWGWNDNRYFYHEGYWGREVGFYGGISYGYGYFGEGYEGGRWDNGRFFYNRSVNNVNTTVIRNVYNTTVINNNTTINRVSYNGGNGGVTARPTPRDQAAERERHIAPVPMQREHIQAARGNQQLRASVNQGRPPVAATPKPAAFNDRAVVPAREAGAPYKREANRQGGNNQSGQRAESGNNNARPGNDNRPNDNRPNGNRPNDSRSNDNNGNRSGNVVHPKDLPQTPRWNAPNSGDPKRDQKYQQQQEKLQSRQDQDHQKLQRSQDREHERIQQQHADEARQQQLEQRHQQQTQQMEQRHTQQQQRMEQKQQPPPDRRNQQKPPRDEHPPN
jgi:hypothetical protein